MVGVIGCWRDIKHFWVSCGSAQYSVHLFRMSSFRLEMFHLCLYGCGSLLLCAGQILNQLICLLLLFFRQSSMGTALISSFPLSFHAFLDFLVNCSVLCNSISIFAVLFVFELSPFGTQIKDVSYDPGLLDWAVFAEDLIGCVSHCCMEGVRQDIYVHVRVYDGECCKLPHSGSKIQYIGPLSLQPANGCNSNAAGGKVQLLLRLG